MTDTGSEFQTDGASKRTFREVGTSERLDNLVWSEQPMLLVTLLFLNDFGRYF